MTTWVISDTHFGHANILDYEPSRRAWCTDIESHDRAIIEAWRAVVQPDDTVIHCGDFALSNRARIAEIVRQLPGRITLVLGNHDRSATAMRECGIDNVVSGILIGSFATGPIIARHAPSSFTHDDLSTDAWLLHGHMHGHVPGVNDAPRDRRHAYPSDPSVRARLIDASIEALPTAPGPMRLAELIARRRGSE
jgi:calcineurin-like phosphoesterase family protein